MKKAYYFLVNCGKVVFIWALLFIVSISLYSLTIKGKVNYGDRCYQNINEDIVTKYIYEGINLDNSNLECNTFYLEYTSNLNEKENLRFLVSLSKLLYENDIDSDMHIIIKSDGYQILSSIVNYQVSYIKSNI